MSQTAHDYEIGMRDVKSKVNPPVQPPVDTSSAEQPPVGGSPDIERANAFTDLPPPAKVSVLSQTASGHDLFETSAIGSPDEQAYARSQSFYQSIGYPQYAGQYQPFEVPAGYRVKSVTKPAGQDQLSVAFEPIATLPDVNKSLTERLATVETKPLVHLQSTGDLAQQIMGGTYGQKQKDVVHPFVGVAANLLAPAEALVYSVGRLVGFKTPSIPVTALSEAISGGIQLVTSGKAELSPDAQRLQQELGSKDFGRYMAGTIFGDIALSYGIGQVSDAIGLTKLVSKATSPITKAVQGRAEDWLTASYDLSAKAGELDQSEIWNPSRLEKFVMGITGTTPRELPTSIIGLPKMVEGEALGMGNLDKFVLGSDIMDLTAAPKTVGLGYTVPVETAKAVGEGILQGVKETAKDLAPYTVYQMGRTISLAQPSGILSFERTPYDIGYSGKLGFVKRHLPTVSDLLGQGGLVQGQVLETPQGFDLASELFGSSALPKLSSLPSRAIDLGDALGLATIIGSGLSIGGKPTTREKLQVEQVSRLKKGQPAISVASVIFGQGSVQRGDVFSGIDLGQTTVQEQKLIPALKLITTQKIPSPNLPRLIGVPPIRLPSSDFGGGARGRGVFGRRKGYRSSLWTIPFPSESALARYIMGGKSKAKKQRRFRR